MAESLPPAVQALLLQVESVAALDVVLLLRRDMAILSAPAIACRLLLSERDVRHATVILATRGFIAIEEPGYRALRQTAEVEAAFVEAQRRYAADRWAIARVIGEQKLERLRLVARAFMRAEP